MVLGIFCVHIKGIKLVLNLSLYTETNSKLIKDPDVKPEMLTLLVEIISSSLYEVSRGKDFPKRSRLLRN